MKIEWIKVDGMMFAIDKATGEILNESLNTLPADYDVSKAVIDVLEDMFGDSVITTAEIKKEKRGRKAKNEFNAYTSYFSNVQYNEDTGTSNMDTSVEDLVYSASTVNSGNTRIPVKQLVYVMRSEQLTTKGIKDLLNKRRIIKGEKPLEDRYCRDVRAAAEHLIKRIDMHQERGTLNLNESSAFQFEADNLAYERSQGVINALLCPVEFTEGDKRTIRALARAGNIQAINDYLQRVTEQSGRMMQRILGEPLSEDSKEAYDKLDAEFPYEPYETDSKYVMRKKALPVTAVVNHEKDNSQKWIYEIKRYVE